MLSHGALRVSLNSRQEDKITNSTVASIPRTKSTLNSVAKYISYQRKRPFFARNSLKINCIQIKLLPYYDNLINICRPTFPLTKEKGTNVRKDVTSHVFYYLPQQRLIVMALCIKRLPSNGTTVDTDSFCAVKRLKLTTTPVTKKRKLLAERILYRPCMKR